MQHYSSNGYYRNVYLGRDDTDGRDELTLRGRWRYQPTDDLRIDLSVLHVQIDNGYDAYSIDNTRTTQSDNPSVDAQHSTGALAARRTTRARAGDADRHRHATRRPRQIRLRRRLGQSACCGRRYIYNYTELQYARSHARTSLEMRLGTNPAHGVDWLVGVYALRLHGSLERHSAGIYQSDPTDPATASVT